MKNAPSVLFAILASTSHANTIRIPGTYTDQTLVDSVSYVTNGTPMGIVNLPTNTGGTITLNGTTNITNTSQANLSLAIVAASQNQTTAIVRVNGPTKLTSSYGGVSISSPVPGPAYANSLWNGEVYFGSSNNRVPLDITISSSSGYGFILSAQNYSLDGTAHSNAKLEVWGDTNITSTSTTGAITAISGSGSALSSDVMNTATFNGDVMVSSPTGSTTRTVLASISNAAEVTFNGKTTATNGMGARVVYVSSKVGKVTFADSVLIQGVTGTTSTQGVIDVGINGGSVTFQKGADIQIANGAGDVMSIAGTSLADTKTTITGTGRFVLTGNIVTGIKSLASNKDAITLTMTNDETGRSVFTGKTSIFAGVGTGGDIHLSLKDDSEWNITGDSTLTDLFLGANSTTVFSVNGSDFSTNPGNSATELTLTSINIEDNANIVLNMSGYTGADLQNGSAIKLVNATTYSPNATIRFSVIGNPLPSNLEWDWGDFTTMGIIKVRTRIPEPSSVMLGLLGLVSLLTRRNRTSI